MQYRRFGRKDWQVSEIGYGMWGMAGWTGSDDDQSLESLQTAIDLGWNFFDTAWAYGEEYVHRSFKNIAVDNLDLIQFHTWEDSWLADDRWAKKMDELIQAGKILSVGISINRWEAWNGVQTVKSGLIDAVQVIYNIFDQNPEDELFPACEENDVAVIARVPFDEGTLTGTLTVDSKWPEGDWRNSYFVPENLKSSIEHAELLKAVLPGDMSMPEMALRFILNNPTVSTIIPGMRKLEHVKSNIAASDSGPVSEELHSVLRDHRWDRTPTDWSQ